MNSKWVVNASPLITLGKISRIDILTKLCDELIIPEGVAKEVLAGPFDDNSRKWLVNKGDVYIKKGISIELKVAAWDIGLGESEVISFCYAHQVYKAVVDDLAARKCAAAFNINCLGNLRHNITGKKVRLN